MEIISKENCIPIEYSSFFKLSGNNVSFTFCTEQLSQNFMKSVNVTWNILDECLKTCTTFRYRGTRKAKHHGITNSSRIIDIAYWFNNENEIEFFQEYLIYEITSVIGSIGGTLGLFIGFSFLDLSTRLITIFKYSFLKNSYINN